MQVEDRAKQIISLCEKELTNRGWIDSIAYELSGYVGDNCFIVTLFNITDDINLEYYMSNGTCRKGSVPTVERLIEIINKELK